MCMTILYIHTYILIQNAYPLILSEITDVHKHNLQQSTRTKMRISTTFGTTGGHTKSAHTKNI